MYDASATAIIRRRTTSKNPVPAARRVGRSSSRWRQALSTSHRRSSGRSRRGSERQTNPRGWSTRRAGRCWAHCERSSLERLIRIFAPRASCIRTRPASTSSSLPTMRENFFPRARAGPMRALLRAQSFRLFDVDDGVGETRLTEGGMGLAVMGKLLGQRLMDGDSLGWSDIDIGMMPIE